MIKNSIKYLLVLSLLVAGWQTIAGAQIADTAIKADIPYDFTVGTTTLPAGKYEIRTLGNIDINTLEIRSDDGHTTVIFETITAQADQTPDKTELVFNKVGDKYFLSRMWLEGNNIGNELEKSKMEKMLESQAITSENISVVAR